MRIRQYRCSKSLSFFEQRLKLKYGLIPYTSRQKPALFYGCYREEDLEAIADHASLGVLIWGGSDAMNTNIVKSVHAVRRSLNGIVNLV